MAASGRLLEEEEGRMRNTVLFVLAALLTASSLPSRGHTLTVDCQGGADYSAIQEAVNASTNGDTIAIAACVYEEQVFIAGVELVLVGEGAASTEITWPEVEPTIEFQEVDLVLCDLTVQHTAGPGYAIQWEGGSLALNRCVIPGRVYGGHYHADVQFVDSDVGWLSVSGGFHASTVERSSIGQAAFGGPWQTCHTLASTESRYGSLMPCFTYCTGDTIGYIQLTGAPDAAQSLEADACRIDTCVGWSSAEMELDACEIGSFTYSVDHFTSANFGISGCLFTGDVDIAAEYKRGARLAGGARGYSFEHNTVLGQLAFDMATSGSGYGSDFLRSNIVVGQSEISCQYDITISHNNFAGGLALDAPSAYVEENISEDPWFCGALAGDYTIHESSPCNGTAHDGLAMGAFPVGCYVPVEQLSWGRLKARFR